MTIKEFVIKNLGKEVEVEGCILKIIGYYKDFEDREFRKGNQQGIVLGEYVSNVVSKKCFYCVTPGDQIRSRKDIEILDEDEYENWILPYHEDINFLNDSK